MPTFNKNKDSLKADINGTYEYGCELFKKRIECAIMIKAAQAGRPR